MSPAPSTGRWPRPWRPSCWWPPRSSISSMSGRPGVWAARSAWVKVRAAMTWPIAMRLWKIFLLAFTGLACLYLVFPTFVILPLSFSSSLYLSFPPPGWSTQWYVALWNSPTYSVAFLHSIFIGLPAAAIAVVFGTMLALALVRGRVWGTRGLTALAIALFLLPQIILAIGLYSILAKFGLTAT